MGTAKETLIVTFSPGLKLQQASKGILFAVPQCTSLPGSHWLTLNTTLLESCCVLQRPQLYASQCVYYPLTGAEGSFCEWDGAFSLKHPQFPEQNNWGLSGDFSIQDVLFSLSSLNTKTTVFHQCQAILLPA